MVFYNISPSLCPLLLEQYYSMSLLPISEFSARAMQNFLCFISMYLCNVDPKLLFPVFICATRLSNSNKYFALF